MGFLAGIVISPVYKGVSCALSMVIRLPLLLLVGLLSLFDQSCQTGQIKFAKLLQTITGFVVDFVIVIVL